MNIMLHGATSGSNFGDFLFAHLYLQTLCQCNENGRNIFFEFPRLGISDFFRSKLHYDGKMKLSDLFGADLLIYISGGYFGERSRSFPWAVLRFVKYVLVGHLFLLRRKPLLVLGVGGGPFYFKMLRDAMMGIIRKAAIVTVRDEESAAYFKSYGVERSVIVTSDTAQVIDANVLPPIDEAIENDLQNLFGSKSIVFFHLSSEEDTDQRIERTLIPPLNAYLSDHPECGVIVSYDNFKEADVQDTNVYRAIQCERKYPYRYHDPWQLCSLLNRADLIITAKLHVGIVGASLSKSVLSFPLHAEKTRRYYMQLGEPERCIPLDEASFSQVLAMLQQYFHKSIVLPEQIRYAARMNLELMKDFVSNAVRSAQKDCDILMERNL